MSALLLAVVVAALIIAGIITGALRLVHYGNAGQLLPMLDASVDSFHQHPTSKNTQNAKKKVPKTENQSKPSKNRYVIVCS